MRKVLRTGLHLAPIPMIVSALLAVFAVGASAAPAHPQNAQLTHTRIQAHVRPRLGRNSTSTNWSGYATTGTTYSDVKGSWKEPTAYCSSGQTAYSSFWVGIDGDGTNSVEQTGTDADCSSGSPVYYAWYEMYPKYPVNLSYTVRPGDAMSAEVKYEGSGKFLLTIHDATRGWTYSTTQRLSSASHGSAEWIAEAPSSSSGVLPLADFGTVNFSSCTANGVSISSNPNPDEIVMVTSSGTVKAQPSGLSGGTAFSVTWKHS